MPRGVRAGNILVLNEKNPHIRTVRVGTLVKMDVNNGVRTMDIWICGSARETNLANVGFTAVFAGG